MPSNNNNENGTLLPTPSCCQQEQSIDTCECFYESRVDLHPLLLLL